MALRGLIAFVLGIVLFGSSVALAQSTTKRPQPPSQICIGSKCATTPEPSAAGALKFHPGVYPYFNYSGGTGLSRFGKDQTLIATLKPGDNVEGIAIALLWTGIDKGTTGPSYDWSVIDAYLNAVKAVGKRLWVRVQEAELASNASVASGRRIVPAWLISKYGIENVQANYAPVPRGVAAKRYSPVVTQAYIDMFQAMAARYDSDPSFEGVTIFEETAYQIDNSGTSVTVNTPGADYSEKAMFDNLYALMAGLRDPAKGFKTSNVQVATNYLFRASDSAANWTDVYTHIQKYRMMAGGPDSWIPSWTFPYLPLAEPQPQRGSNTAATLNPLFKRGLYADEVMRGWVKGSTDWRGKILFGPDVEATDFGGYITKSMNPLPTLADIWEIRGKVDRAHYFFFDISWEYSGNYGGTAQHWSTGQYPWVKTMGKTNTTNPYQ